MSTEGFAPGDTDALIRYCLKIASVWFVPPDPAVDRDDLRQESILAGLRAVPRWDETEGFPLKIWVGLQVQQHLKKVCAMLDPRRRTSGQIPKEGDPRRERHARFSEMGEEWEPAIESVDCLTLMQRAFLKAAIESQDPKTRAIVRGVLFEGRGTEDVAKELGIGERSAYALRHEGLKSLWILLTGENPYTSPERRGKFCPRGHDAEEHLNRWGHCTLCKREKEKVRRERKKP